MGEEISTLPEYSQDDLERSFIDAFNAAENLHMKLSSLAEDAGYMVSMISNTKPAMDSLYNRAQSDSTVYPIVASGIDFLKGLTNEMNRLSEESDGPSMKFVSLVNSTTSFGGTVDASSEIFELGNITKPYTYIPTRKSRNDYSVKLKSLDVSLGKTYDQVWQTYLGTSAEPHRSALFMMRTLFDNFFAWLAPDEEVCRSHHWHKKDGDKPNQIWRSERLAYALEKHIKDKDRHSILAATTNQIGALYDAANEAHNRGALDEDKASKTIVAMENFLKDWLDSIE